MSSSTTIERPRVSPPDVWPPDDDGDGGGGGGGGGDGRPPEPNESGPPISVSRMATLFVLAMVTMLFAAWFSEFVILRIGNEWPPPNFPRVPENLWTATIVIALSSLTGFLAVRSAHRGRLVALRYWLFVTWGLGISFCVTQAILWRHLTDLGTKLRGGDVFSGNVFALTGLHVAHVIGGIVYLTICFARAMTRHKLRGLPESVGNCMLYWHFVGVIWYAIFFLIS